MRRTTILFLAAILLAACGRGGEPDVVLVTLDTTRADRLGAMGRAEARTPVLDALAARGVVYDRAYASAPLTLPSHATILTGLDPDRHGVRDNGRFVLPPAVPTVAERLAARGYDTAAFVAAYVLDASFGLGRGFARYDDALSADADPLRFEVPRRTGREVTDRALAWLGERRGGRFFLWVHYYDVHLPRQPPPPFDALSDPYDGALAYVDAEVGRLLDGVARAAAGRDSLIIVVGDHGEALGEHDEETHGILAYDSTLHVPLIVVGPGFPAGRRAAQPVRTVDVAPTILAAAAAAPLEGSDGRALDTRLAAGTDDDTPGYFECLGPFYRMGWSRLAGVRSGRWKYTAEPSPVELYDTVADPGETVNRAGDEPAVVERLERLWKARTAGAPAPPASTSASAAADAAEKLAALGYVDVFQQFPADAVPDPRRFVGAVQLVDAARMLAVEGHVAQSIRTLEAIAASPVARPLALASLAPLYLLVDRDADAIRAAEALVAISGGPAPRVMLAKALVAGGRAEDALQALDTAASADGSAQSSVIRLVRGQVLLELGRPGDARAEADAVLATAPLDDAAMALASRARANEEGAAVEIPRLEERLRAVPSGTRLVETRATLAALLEAEGRDAEAVRVLEADPHPSPEYRATLAEIAARHGNPERAAGLWEGVVAERPAMQVYRRRLADVYDTLGRFDDALVQHDAMVAADPENAELLVDRGAVEAKVGRVAAAEQDYRHAIGVDGTLPEAFLNLALIELADGRQAEAEAHLLRAVELRPDYQKAHFHLARIYRERGDPRAREQAEQAVGAARAGGTTK